MLYAAVFQAEGACTAVAAATASVVSATAAAVVPTAATAILLTAEVPPAIGAAEIGLVAVAGEGISAYLVEGMAGDKPHATVVPTAIDDIHKDASFLELVYPMLTERRRCVFCRKKSSAVVSDC